MRKTNVIPGQTFNRWTILSQEESERDSKGIPYKRFKVKCFCGEERILRIGHIISGKSKSCGCLRAETTTNRNTKHGLRWTRLYNIWLGMKQRCNNPKHPRYADYGGRGIKVCTRWNNNFENFYNDMRQNYLDELSIDRINNDGNYEPSNCRWATALEQRLNQKRGVA